MLRNQWPGEEQAMNKTHSAMQTGAALEESLRLGFTLPAEWYTDHEVFTAERKQIFRRSWQFAGFVEQLAERGSFFSTRIGDAPLVLTRDQDGLIHAFINVCRHRGSELVQAESGHRQTLQCHYHAWTYNLDGSLRSAPGAKNEPDFNPDLFPLISVPVDVWGPLLFVNLDHQAEPLHTVLGELPWLTAASGASLDALHRRVRHTYDVAANWKVVVDNYLECYHCPIAHKSFSAVIDTNQYAVTEYEWCSVQTGALKTSEGGDTSHMPYSTQGSVQAGFYAYLWPNFTLNVYPGQGNVSINHFVPLVADRTLVVKDYCFTDEVSADEEAEFVRFIDEVQEEDEILCESVQRGLSSGYFEQGRLMLSQERALRHFQQLVYRALDGA
jgi:phenylpropionate dioxygenase-like ring-hydroxylating dioxygenase large terminal subunit